MLRDQLSSPTDSKLSYSAYGGKVYAHTHTDSLSSPTDAVIYSKPTPVFDHSTAHHPTAMQDGFTSNAAMPFPIMPEFASTTPEFPYTGSGMRDTSSTDMRDGFRTTAGLPTTGKLRCPGVRTDHEGDDLGTF